MNAGEREMPLFGTDGVRGVAGRDLTPELALALGRALGLLLHEERPDVGRPYVLVGRDSRLSGNLLEAALVSGLMAAGVDVIRLGVLPTPAVAFLTVHRRAAAGAMISASHNPIADNGIKFFGPDGMKLPDDQEARVAAHVAQGEALVRRPWPEGEAVGRERAEEDLRGHYEAHLLTNGPDSLDGMRIVVDAACGAAAGLLTGVLRRLGAQVVALHDVADGARINVDCGSTHPEAAQRAVRERGADVGITLDGDADRLIAIDERGELVDGDALLAIFGLDLARRGMLAHNTVVATQMSNGGLRVALRQAGIDMTVTPVGDRFVLAEMERGGYTLGGEQSGHIILRHAATTGDGELSAMALLEVLRRTGEPLSALAGVMRRMPQRLLNLPWPRGAEWRSPAVIEAIAEAESIVGDDGRVLVRASGTEPLLRVMVEGPEAEGVERAVARVAAAAALATR
jgi:phosphoglucosamine mutase